MFGLMKKKGCALTDQARTAHRLHYCGTCKTLGSLYGSKARLLLNHDTVFLAELLSALSDPPTELASWSRQLRSFNCLSCPAPDAPMPLPLRYAAAATMVLTEWKLSDRLNDSGRSRWRVLQRLYAGSFGSAAAQLTEWRFPLDRMRSILLSQEQRESSSQGRQSAMTASQALDLVSEPTAQATALFCSHAAILIGRGECGPDLYAAGHSLGSIVYLLDAVEDFAEDRRKGNFNAIRSAYAMHIDDSDQSDAGIPAPIREQVLDKIRDLHAGFEQALRRLPLAEGDCQGFIARMRWNLKRTLGLLPASGESQPGRTLQPAGHACMTRMTIAQRWRNAVQYGTSLSRAVAPDPAAPLASRLASRLARPIMFASVLPIAFFSPQQVAGAASYRECMSLGFNLMFAGAVASSLANMVSWLMPYSAQQNLALSSGLPEVALKGKKRSPEGDSSSGCGDGCSACDCCCDADCCGSCDCGGCDC